MHHPSSASTPSTNPLTTRCVPLSAATSTPSAPLSSISASTRSAEANTAVIAPASDGRLPISSPRTAASLNPSSNPNTPATCAAASSPTLCPNTATGRTPTLSHNADNAHPNAYSAGCVHVVSSTLPTAPSRPNITSSSDSPRNDTISRSQRSSTARTTGSRPYSARPIPAHWLP